MNKELFIYHFYFDEYGEGTMFVDESGDILSVVDANDGNWRGEYFNTVIKQLGIPVYETENNSDTIKNNLRDYLGY